MATLKDIAIVTGINAGSVAHVLNNSPKALKIRKETREKIFAAAKELGYHKNEHASVIRSGVSRIVALICDFPSGAFPDPGLYAGRIMSGAISEATKNNHSIKLYDAKNLGASLDNMECYRIRHVVMLGVGLEERRVLAEWSRRKDARLVFVTEESVGEFPCVRTADQKGAFAATRRLLELGHTRIGILCADHSSYYARERHSGYAQALEEAGITPDERLAVCVSDDRETEKGVQKILSMRKSGRPTAFFCIGDFGMLLLQRAMMLRGLMFPEDISIVSFGGGIYSRYAVRPLTCVSQPFEEMGAVAVRLSLGLDTTQDSSGNICEVPTELIIGESDGPCARQ